MCRLVRRLHAPALHRGPGPSAAQELWGRCRPGPAAPGPPPAWPSSACRPPPAALRRSPLPPGRPLGRGRSTCSPRPGRVHTPAPGIGVGGRSAPGRRRRWPGWSPPYRRCGRSGCPAGVRRLVSADDPHRVPPAPPGCGRSAEGRPRAPCPRRPGCPGTGAASRGTCRRAASLVIHREAPV